MNHYIACPQLVDNKFLYLGGRKPHHLSRVRPYKRFTYGDEEMSLINTASCLNNAYSFHCFLTLDMICKSSYPVKSSSYRR